MSTQNKLDRQVRYCRAVALLGSTVGPMGFALCLAVVLAFMGGFYSAFWLIAERSAASVGSLLVFTALFGFFAWLRVTSWWILATTPARIVPYFERRFGAHGRKAFWRGLSLARQVGALDEAALRADVPTLSTYGFGDDMLWQRVNWHSAAGGLRTLDGIDAAVDTNLTELAEDLRALRSDLEESELADVRFALVARLGRDKLISLAEMDLRTGVF